MREFIQQFLEFAATGWGPVVLVVHSYFESFIIPVAHDLFLTAVCLARPEYSFLFALLSTVSSVLGISTGYALGKWGGGWILRKVMKPDMIEAAQDTIHKYDIWAIAIACFTPIPVKVFAWVAGSVSLNFKKLIFVAFLARGARFTIVAAMIYFFGETAKEWIFKYLNWIMIALFVGFFLTWFLFRFLPVFLRKKAREAS